MSVNGFAPRWAYRLVLLAALAGMIRLNWPGHFSVDSVLALHEGRFGLRETWNPAIFGWLLGGLDRIQPGAALALVLNGVLLFGSWMLLPTLRPRAHWLGTVVALGVIALPQVLIYPAIVWKDVMFAVAAVAGFVVLALSVQSQSGLGRWFGLILSALLFAIAGLLRQNGLILALPAALALAWATSVPGWARAVRRGFGWLASVAVLALILSIVAQPQGVGAPDGAGAKGIRLLQSYDLAAAAALQPGRAMPNIDRVAPSVGDYLRDNAARIYSPERVDTMTADPWLAKHLPSVSRATIQADWFGLITGDPGLYLRGRWLAFQQVLATPEIDRCLPVHVGVTGPAKALSDLKMARRADAQDGRIYNYVTWFLDTPAMSHLAYAALAICVFVLLMLRRDPADLIMASLMVGALGFAASFFVISIACDYRYLYVLDLAALTGVLYLAIDPRLRRT